MEKLVVEGLHTLQGTVRIHGAKNSALPLLAATLLPSSPSVIENCPPLSDVTASIAILRHLGCEVAHSPNTAEVTPGSMCRTTIPEHLMREMRSSIVFLGAILSRAGEAHLCFPGGCELGPRPVDLHLAALSQMGVDIEENGGELHCRVPDGLHGAHITLSFPSVGATENILLAAVLAKGETVICNAACEPEIVDLCAYLNACGACIEGAGESTVRIQGVKRLIGCRFSVMPDRIEAATYMAACAVTGGALTLTGVQACHMAAVIAAFEESGCTVQTQAEQLHLKASARLRRIKTVRTMPYPGFPTDAQAPLMAMMTVADGTSLFVENIFENRYKHVGELTRMGARIKTEGRAAVVEGVEVLSGARVCCTDLRGGAAMVVAALAAQGKTEITQLHHLDRGYAALAETLQSVGASIRRVD